MKKKLKLNISMKFSLQFDIIMDDNKLFFFLIKFQAYDSD